ncbi:hypothetical protein [Janthinobacterium svalbardensis]|uniref:hypothetical protein n=1 Tax=Janthinobacterium svalbardensis TaxID=368607 RepID=UPI002FCDB447
MKTLLSLLLLVLPCISNATAITCVLADIETQKPEEVRVNWDDADKTKIEVNEKIVPRKDGPVEVELREFGSVVISWCELLSGADGPRAGACYSINRTTGDIKKFGYLSGTLWSAGSCDASRKNKF